MPATTAAHAPVPQASVSPAPRSHTLSFTCAGDAAVMMTGDAVRVFDGEIEI